MLGFGFSTLVLGALQLVSLGVGEVLFVFIRGNPHCTPTGSSL